MTYESHITVQMDFLPGDERHTKIGQLAKVDGFKTSFIYGDPVLGDKYHFYLTKYDACPFILKDTIYRMAEKLKEAGFEVLRLKIEAIIYDKQA